MSREAGFMRADVDTGLNADPKVVALARRLRDPMATAAHVALYQALVLASWGAGDRITLEQAAPAWFLEPVDEVQANLQAVNLVDADGRILEHAWSSWFGPALVRRQTFQERAAKGGRASRKGPQDKHEEAWGGLEVEPEPASSEHQHSTAQPAQPAQAIPTIPVIPRAAARGNGLEVDRV